MDLAKDMLQIGILISSTGGLNANLKKLILPKIASKREPKDSPLSNYVSISNLDGRQRFPSSTIREGTFQNPSR